MRPILFCLGTRPEVIKLAPVISEARRRGLATRVVATGQHREMAEQALEAFGLRPDIDLGLMQPGQGITSLLANGIAALDREIEAARPRAVIVQGDTTTALAGTLVAAYRQVPLGHVEAGLRTGDLGRPFPEEANRRLIAPIASWHFCPTSVARSNLLREGVDPLAVHVTGNTVIDAALTTRERLAKVDRAGGVKRILVTMHRRESQGAPQQMISRMIAALAERTDIHVVFPLHLSPDVRRSVLPELEGRPNVTLCEPLDYVTFIEELARCYLVLTDSGGVQEEAPAFNVPVLVMRDTTERPEGIEAGCAVLCGTEPEEILRATLAVLNDDDAYRRMAQAKNPYGDGQAASRIVEALVASGSTEPARGSTVLAH